jgi:hypothetical protein
MSYTPGPWSVMPTPTDAQNTHKIMYDCVQERRRIGAVCGVFAKDDGEATANARLIAAAPELLEALRHLVARVIENGGTGDLIDSALAAIAKAEGITTEVDDGKERSLD